MAVGVDLLGPQVVHDLDRALPEDVALKDVRQAGLRIHGENQDAMALLGQPVAGGGREGGLAQPALAPEHDVAALRMGPEHAVEVRLGSDGHQPRESVMSRSRNMRRFQVLIWGTT